MAATLLFPEVQSDSSSGNYNSFQWKTILLNCSCHSFDQVERQLLKSIHCSLARARKISYEVHHTGSSVVYNGPLERCEAVAEVLEQIGLLVKITQ